MPLNWISGPRPLVADLTLISMMEDAEEYPLVLRIAAVFHVANISRRRIAQVVSDRIYEGHDDMLEKVMKTLGDIEDGKVLVTPRLRYLASKEVVHFIRQELVEAHPPVSRVGVGDEGD